MRKLVVKMPNCVVALVMALNVELLVLLVDPVTTEEVDMSSVGMGDEGLAHNVSWWAESVSLALGDLATRALGHDQLQQLYDNSVCMTSLTPSDVNVSQHVLDAASMFGQFISSLSKVGNQSY